MTPTEAKSEVWQEHYHCRECPHLAEDLSTGYVACHLRDAMKCPGLSGYVLCRCGHVVEQYDRTHGGADSSYSRGAACEFDTPAIVECEECGLEWADGVLA